MIVTARGALAGPALLAVVIDPRLLAQG